MFFSKAICNIVKSICPTISNNFMAQKRNFGRRTLVKGFSNVNTTNYNFIKHLHSSVSKKNAPLDSKITEVPIRNSLIGSVTKFMARNYTNKKLIDPKNVPIRYSNFLMNTSVAAESTSPEKKPLLDPNCKVAVITGGTGAIGYATANLLLCIGAKHVALIGLNTQKGLDAVQSLNCAHGDGKASFISCDVTERSALANTFRLLKQQCEHLDMFVNCAGSWNESDWSKTLSVNINGMINVNLEILAACAKSNAVIVNLTGNQGLGVFPSSPIFAASNSAIIEFSRSFGHDKNSKKTGLRIITLCTGITKTDFVKSLDEKMLTQEMGKDLKEVLKALPTQNAEACARAILELIRNGENGSIWVVENSKLLTVKLPDWRGQSVVVSHYT